MELLRKVKKKDYIPKIVHRKLITSIKGLNESNNINKYRVRDRDNFIIKTYKNANIKTIENQNIVNKINLTFSDKKENNNE